MNKKMIAPEISRRLDWWGGLFFFIAFIASDFALGINAAVKVMGVACIVTGVVWFVRRSVPVGIESRPPSFYLRGRVARFIGIGMMAFGVVLMRYSYQAACLLGWAG